MATPAGDPWASSPTHYLPPSGPPTPSSVLVHNHSVQPRAPSPSLPLTHLDRTSTKSSGRSGISVQSTHSRDVSGSPTPSHPSFPRAPPQSAPGAYGPFVPLEIPAAGPRLEDGFMTALPSVPGGGPHPFATHDVTEADWQRFLRALCAAGSHTNGGSSNVALPAGRRGLISSALVTAVSRLDEKGDPVDELIRVWNQSFFYPRCMEVALMSDGHRPGGHIGAGHSDNHAGSALSPSALFCHERRKARREERRPAGRRCGPLRQLKEELLSELDGQGRRGDHTSAASNARYSLAVRYRPLHG